MSRLANVSGREAIRTHGDHVILHKGSITVAVPNQRNVKVGTLRNIIRQAGLTVEQFLDLL
jgi:predicted RNA binding protein YcfA (HicA-like mRNA interferase family)